MTDNNNSNLFYRLLGNDHLQQSDPYSPNNNNKVEHALHMPLLMVLLAKWETISFAKVNDRFVMGNLLCALTGMN